MVEEQVPLLLRNTSLRFWERGVEQSEKVQLKPDALLHTSMQKENVEAKDWKRQSVRIS